MQWITQNLTAVSLLGAAIAFSWSVIQFAVTHKSEQKARNFEHYHRLVKELVSPDSPESGMWIDRQIAIVFELRRFKDYYEVTERILRGLKGKWENDKDFIWPRLLEEIDITLKAIR